MFMTLDLKDFNMASLNLGKRNLLRYFFVIRGR